MFVDEMVKGPFQSMKHRHLFQADEGATLMIDEFDYTSPLGILGKAADFLFLRIYMKMLLTKRNDIIKKVAESGVDDRSLTQL